MRGGRRSSSDLTVFTVGERGKDELHTVSMVGLWARPKGEKHRGG
jgi:hypothetical protein